MSYLIDTNTIIFFFHGKYRIREKIAAVGLENCFVSEITIAELFYGAYYSDNPEQNRSQTQQMIESFKIIPISEAL